MLDHFKITMISLSILTISLILYKMI